MTATLERPQMGVMFFPSGEWMVSTPLLIIPEGGSQETGMRCPHRTYQEVKRERMVTDELGPVMVVVEKCLACGMAQRFRYRKSGEAEPSPQEIFKGAEPPVPPVECPGYERTYDFGTFGILIRRHDPYPGAPLVFMARVDAGPASYVTMMSVPEIVFSQAAAGLLDSLLKVLRMTPERYANARILQERRPRNNLPEMRTDAQELYAVAMAIGKDMLERARGGMEQEIEKEYAEAHAASIEEGRRVAEQLEASLKEMREARDSGQVTGKDLGVLTQDIDQAERELAEVYARLKEMEEGQ